MALKKLKQDNKAVVDKKKKLKDQMQYLIE
jgi:hypothetical protein